MNKFLSILVVALIIPPYLFSCTQQGIKWNTWGNSFPYPVGWNTVGKSFTYPMLKPGEMIDDMVITTGVENAVPFWAFCSPKKVNDHSISADCGDLSYANLAIGHTFGVMDLVDPSIGWEELNWEMSLDGRPIDLAAFGVYDFVHPDFPSKPLREVFRVLRVWDVVLVNPSLGTHRLQGQAQTPDRAETYTWVVDFTVDTSLQPAFVRYARLSDIGYQKHQ
jgi:hypothetical protein